MPESRGTEAPSGVPPLDGVAHLRSPRSFQATVGLLSETIQAAGAQVFAMIDQRDEAEGAGMTLRPTTLVMFGNPKAGTPIMEHNPQAALDLPLKILVWQDDADGVWISYLSADWLAARHHLPPELVPPLAAADRIARKVASAD
jgi:uncharacterized protein (DUF302 family)